MAGTSVNLNIFLVWLGLASIVCGHQYCNEDADCMGELLCMKSACEWGICACKRGYVSRYNGSNRKFQCVRMKKIGERCSTDDDRGVCGAANSDCVEGLCTCDDGYEARWGGEECLSTKTPYPMETCSDGLGSTCHASTCTKNGDWDGAFSGSAVQDLPNVPYDGVPNVCACATGYRTLAPNAYEVASYVGVNVPTCEKIKVGDKCSHDQDCSQIQKADGSGGWTSTSAAECRGNVCRCEDIAHSPDITGLFCATGLNHGESCMSGGSAVSSATGVCNGDLGLRCGDQCDIETALGTGNHVCQCDAAYITSDTTCEKREEGEICNGDLNCKGIGSNAVCDNGKCRSDAVEKTAHKLATMFALLVAVTCC